MDMNRFRECLRMGVAPGLLHQATRLNDTGKGDAPPPPDYSGIAAANEKSAQYAKEAADNDLAFRKQVYADSQPMQRGLYELSQRVANSQLDDAATSRSRGLQQWNQYQNTFVPVEQEMVREAMDYGGAADQARQAGRAVGDVRTQSALARQIAARNMASMGVNPNSGRFAAMNRGDSLREAAMAASGANNARIQARDKGIGLRSGAAAFGRNQVNTAGQMTGLSTASGSSAVGNANTGFMSGLPYAQFASGGVGNQLQAAGQGIQANLGLGSLMNAGYNAQVQAANSGSGLGELGSLMGGAAAMGLKFSDRRLKKDVELVGVDEKTGLNLYEFSYHNDDKRYRGVMADEVESFMPEAVEYNAYGFALVDYDRLGIQMEEV